MSARTTSKDSAKPRLTTSAMIASIAAEGQATKPAPFGHALVAAAKANPKIVGMTADLGKYTDLHIFKEAFPDRHIQMGMAEQLLFGAAAGLAHEGFIPFATTYAVFASRRAYDFIHQTIAEENLPVKIAAALPGLTSGYGPSHQAAEDLALPGLRAVQTVVEKRATFACTPALARPPRVIAPGLQACGDYVAGPYPATLEGAVLHGAAAAQDLGQNSL